MVENSIILSTPKKNVPVNLGHNALKKKITSDEMHSEFRHTKIWGKCPS